VRLPMSNLRFDSLDYEIIQALRRILRTDAAKIAREINANERTVRKRLNRLIDQGVIQMSVIVNPSMFDYDLTVLIYLKVAPAHEDEALPTLLNMSEVAYLAFGQGEDDIHLQAYFKTYIDMRKFIHRVLPSVPGVQVISNHLVLDVIKHAAEWMPVETDFRIPLLKTTQSINPKAIKES
jgi:Lrp/AsnC family transcriptional regulator for asnA, asnC and gidA